jgi:cytoskeletal protein CcmA (bactofilin family)
MTETEQSSETSAPQRGFRQRDHGSGNTVVIGPRDSLLGKLTVDGDVRIQGLLEGELNATGDVHVEGSVNAPIEARNVTIRGTVNGDVTAKDRLLMAGSGVLTGNAKIGRISIEDGATLNGNVTMGGGKGRPPANHENGNGEAQAGSEG